MLLTDLLERRVATLPAPAFGDPIPAGAVAGLSRFKGRDVVDTLSRALADPRNAQIRTVLVRALFDIGTPDVIPPLVQALSSSDPILVIQAISWLDAFKAAVVIPRFVVLPKHANPSVRERSEQLSKVAALHGPR